MKKQKTSIMMTEKGTTKLNDLAARLGITKSKIVEVLVRNIETNTIKDEFDFYNIKVKK